MEYQQIPIDMKQPDMPILDEEAGSEALPDGFVYLDEALSGISWDAKYATWDNFTGAPVAGYSANRIVISAEMIEPLKKARDLARDAGWGLLVWDAARPQRAVDAFSAWAREAEDGRTRDSHYPRISKADMFKKGYIATKSGHSRGAAIDLTLTDHETGEALDMGTGFDYMDARSHHGATGLTSAQQKNRAALLSIMEAAGFVRYEREWWHYSLKVDPHPGTYYDFVIGGD